MKKIVLFIFGLAALMFASCGQKEKNVKQLEQQYLVQPVDSFSGKDTSEVMYLVNSFIDKLNQKDIKSAVSMLSYLDGNDIVPLPAGLVKRQCNALANAQGVKYTVDRLVFNEEKDNIVKVNILLFEKKPGDTRPNSISLYLKPIRRDNRWYIIRKTKCFRILERNAKISKTKRNFSRLYPTPQKFKKIDRLRRNEIHLKAVRTSS